MYISEIENWPSINDGWEHEHSGIPIPKPEGCDPYKQEYQYYY